jgi:hypothetical protein
MKILDSTFTKNIQTTVTGNDIGSVSRVMAP